jgi:hypothetical protein
MRRARNIAIGTLSGSVVGLLAVMVSPWPVLRDAQADDSADPPLTSAAADFHNLCAPCHGESGKGDGPVGQALKTKPADLTQIAQRHDGAFPENLIFETIEGLDMPLSHGTRDMPIWGDVFVAEAVGDSVSLAEAKKAGAEARKRIEGLVSYLKTIQTAD